MEAIIEDKMLREKQVMDYVGVGKTKLWDMIKNKEFTSPFRLGGCSVWFLSDVQDFIAAKKKEHRKLQNENKSA